jgi:hypothetical protein
MSFDRSFTVFINVSYNFYVYLYFFYNITITIEINAWRNGTSRRPAVKRASRKNNAKFPEILKAHLCAKYGDYNS